MSVACVVVSLVWLRWGGIRKGIWVDLDVYVRGAAAVMQHDPLYSVSVHGLPFTYPPFAAVLFVPLQVLGQGGARWALTVASMGCYVVVVAVCARRLRISPALAGLVGLAGLTFEPFLRNILLGQINLVLLALIVVDCLLIPARYRGILVGVATGVKLLPGAFVLFFLLRRDWWAAGRAAAAFAVTVAVGAAFAPRDSLLFWSGGFINLSRFGKEAIIGGDNQSLSAALMRLTHDLTPPTALVFLLSAGAMALGLFAAKWQIDSGNEVNALVCIGFASLLASPVSWTHHWLWALIALLVLVQHQRRVLAVVLGVVFVIGPMWFTPRGQLLELRHTWWQAVACVSYVVIALAYLAFFAAAGRVLPPHSTPALS
ncbi:MAG: alpha,2-mannosyltransferase, partial [Actinomycetota bacterium]|nr:alpha,2-mannosyltransferase [Actinomycetota bacterium]